jgi:purine nucleoside phosphorylase
MKKIRKFENDAKAIAHQLRETFNIKSINPVGIILGTGWGDKLLLDDMEFMPLAKFHYFNPVPSLSGHERSFFHGFINETEVVGLSGRFHLNETPGDLRLFKKVRLQTQALMELGVKKLITTAAVGSLPGKGINVADIVIVEKLLTLFAPQMPLWAGEFVSPEDVLSKDFSKIAYNTSFHDEDSVKRGTHAMLLGPNFESRKPDKEILSKLGADVVGMSILPDCCIAALYDAKVLALGFVTNDFIEVHSHEHNQNKAKEYSAKLSSYLSRVIQDI